MQTRHSQDNAGQSSLKVIAAIGVITFLFLMMSSLGLKKGLTPDESQRLTEYRAQSDVDGARAYRLAEDLAGLGPRHSRSEALVEARDLLRRTARDAGLILRELPFDNDGIQGAHLSAEIPGNRPGSILLATQFDTAVLPDRIYLSANDGTSDSALLMELARVLRKNWRHGRTLRFVWFDGTRGNAETHGPKAYLDALPPDEQPDAVIALRMVGDCYLNATTGAQSDEALARILDDTAQRFGLRDHLGPAPVPPDIASVADAFRETDARLLSLVDPQYGGSLLEHDKNFRGPGDSIEKVCPQSLQAIGDVVYHALPAIDGYLGGS